jgi:hypothetical protein
MVVSSLIWEYGGEKMWRIVVVIVVVGRWSLVAGDRTAKKTIGTSSVENPTTSPKQHAAPWHLAPSKRGHDFKIRPRRSDSAPVRDTTGAEGRCFEQRTKIISLPFTMETTGTVASARRRSSKFFDGTICKLALVLAPLFLYSLQRLR